ncbi:Putative XAP5 protein [Septoria linicola]|uniref:XAP5 protein n=1 Tax=Septoria linicola TaxID=215465 RepID=A0A9Q9AYE6_9PEZI|nr:putative XAP5 protein [Septoria linicola]USW57399.1 Putative XAP5 protein [Septoria linicola]
MADNSDNRFVSKAPDVEDRLKADTVGLVTLDDFRKRRAEAAEGGSGTTTPDGREGTPKSTSSSLSTAPFKKRKKAPAKRGGLSFANDDGDDENEQQQQTAGEDDWASVGATPNAVTRANTPAGQPPGEDSDAASTSSTTFKKKKSLRPNSSIGLQPKALTKSALLKEAQLKDALRKEYVQIQEAVKATEFVLPFVFYDGKNAPGGKVRLKKGDHVWLFLERARKVGAELGKVGDRGRKDWARISVDDLMVVKGDLILGHHYDFHYFLLNKTIGYNGRLFSNAFSAEPTTATPKHLLPTKDATSIADEPSTSSETPTPGTTEISGVQTAAQIRQQKARELASALPDSDLEGFDEDPNLTKVVDRRWYEKNKHIYPASSWEEFDPAKEEDYKKGVRKDKDGNAMFFSR